MRPLKMLTWHTHGSYLYCLTHAPHQFYVLSRPGRPPGHGGRYGHMPWGENVIDMPVEQARHQQFDCILFQDDDQYLKDQHAFLTPAQRRLPRIYLEHDAPREHPTDMRHPVDDPELLLVHVTHFNALMWDNGRLPVRMIEHGMMVPEHARYTGAASPPASPACMKTSWKPHRPRCRSNGWPAAAITIRSLNGSTDTIAIDAGRN